MPLLFIDYTNLVLKAYEEKREANRLSRLLMHPTTANLRQECLNVYHERLKEGEVEEDILRSFFGVPPAGKNFDYIIERYHADRFRPLRSFIKRKIKNPTLINVEMLAWLIDFNPRPLAYAQKMLGYTTETSPGNLNGQAGIEEDEVITINDRTAENQDSPLKYETTNSKDNRAKTPEAENKKGNGFFKRKSNAGINNNKIKIVGAIGILVILLGGIYIFQSHRETGKTAFGNSNTSCMYWEYDHYQQVPCNQERKGRLFLPLEEEKIKSFKRITRKDTITQWSIGKIYYIKDNNKIKYYTEPGNYPEDLNRSLKKLSQIIFEKDSINRKIPD